MVDKDGIVAAIKARLNRVLLAAEAALPEGQFRAFRKLVLDEFGNSSLGKDLDRLCGKGKSPD